MGQIIWTQKAITDLEDIGEFIGKNSPKFAAITINSLFNAVYLLEDNDKLGRVVPELGNQHIREIIMGNYRLIYRINAEKLEILTVHHSARDLKRRNIK